MISCSPLVTALAIPIATCAGGMPEAVVASITEKATIYFFNHNSVPIVMKDIKKILDFTLSKSYKIKKRKVGFVGNVTTLKSIKQN